MKKLFFAFLAMSFFFAMFIIPAIAQVDTTALPAHPISPENTPVPGSSTMEWVYWGIGIFIFLWETILRIIPTAKDWTLLGKIVNILNGIAYIFNGVGNAAKTQDGTKRAFKQKAT